MNPAQISCRDFSLLGVFLEVFSGLCSDSTLCTVTLCTVTQLCSSLSTACLNVIEVVVSSIIICAVLGRNSQIKPNGFLLMLYCVVEPKFELLFKCFLCHVCYLIHFVRLVLISIFGLLYFILFSKISFEGHWFISVRCHIYTLFQ